MIIKQLTDIVKVLGNEGVELGVGDKAWQNYIADFYEFDNHKFGVFLDFPMTYRPMFKDGFLSKIYFCSMTFFVKSIMNEPFSEKDCRLDYLRDIVDEFAVRVVNSESFDRTFNNNFVALEVFDFNDVNCDGITLAFSVKTLNKSLCIT
jgi:hypothetical protein